jgi:hypothetical protein
MQHDEGFRDPFTGQTVENGEPLSKSTSAPAHETRESASPASPSMPMTDRRMSREWGMLICPLGITRLVAHGHALDFRRLESPSIEIPKASGQHLLNGWVAGQPC